MATQATVLEMKPARVVNISIESKKLRTSAQLARLAQLRRRHHEPRVRPIERCTYQTRIYRCLKRGPMPGQLCWAHWMGLDLAPRLREPDMIRPKPDAV